MSSNPNWLLKSLITARYGTQADFAQEIGRVQSFVSEVVRGRRELNAQERQRWARALEIDEIIFENWLHGQELENLLAHRSERRKANQ